MHFAADCVFCSLPTLPIWAVCVYQKPEELWRVPLLIEANRASTQFSYYLRKYGSEGWETVLYAVPTERLKTTILS